MRSWLKVCHPAGACNILADHSALCLARTRHVLCAGPNLKFVGKLVLGIVLPISLLAIGAAAIFAFLFFKYKRRYAVSFVCPLQ